MALNFRFKRLASVAKAGPVARRLPALSSLIEMDK